MLVVVVGRRRRARARQDADRDDLRRIGDGTSVDGHEAARRASGGGAWSRADF